VHALVPLSQALALEYKVLKVSAYTFHRLASRVGQVHCCG
jgi:hypothetical protein